MRRGGGGYIGSAFVDPTHDGAIFQNPATGVWYWSDMKELAVWVTRDRRLMTIAEMETEHIQRAIANILIRGNWRLGYLPLLVEELEKRGVGQ
jgi:hypothetical protein